LALSPRLRWRLDQIRKKMDGIFSSRQEQPRPKLCPACGTLVGATATRCHQCGASLTFSLAAASKSLGSLMPATSPVTYTILAMSCLLYIVSLLATIRVSGFAPPEGGFSGIFGFGGINGRILVLLGASLPMRMEVLQPWRLVTAIFLHGSIMHIVFNMWFFMDVGPMIEEAYGSARYFFIYIATGVCGYVFSSSVGNHVSVGGSGAIMGLVGVLLAMTMGRRSAGMQALRNRLYFFLIYIAVLGFIWPAVDNFAHAGGFISGFILGKFMTDLPPATPEARKRAYALGWGTATVVVASFVMMVLWVRHATGLQR
jgi:rhomboid protease GluP